jgi:hypothetical protein
VGLEFANALAALIIFLVTEADCLKIWSLDIRAAIVHTKTMARRVFFSFHYERDIFRVSQIRNSGITKGSYEQSGFIDHADWESLERQGDDAIKRWINSQLNGASVSVVLIGAETFNRPWVNYEIQQSYSDRKGMLGVYIHQLKERTCKCQLPRKGPKRMRVIGYPQDDRR